MRLRIPDYYEKFQCIADRCQHNCCQEGWLIELDRETVKQYEKVPGELGEKLRDSVVQSGGEYYFQLENGACPFLDDSHLCSIYGKLGESYMGFVCREFPRYTEYYGQIKEMGIGMACEEAVRIMLSQSRPVRLIEKEIPVDTIYATEKVDESLARAVFTARNYCISVLQNRNMELTESIRKALLFAERMQKQINQNAFTQGAEGAEEKVKRVIQQAEQEWSAKKLQKESMQVTEDDSKRLLEEILLDFREHIVLEPEWVTMLDQVQEHIAQADIKQSYQTLLREKIDLEIEQEQVVVYYAYRYFAKAVYDNNFFDKVRFAVVAFLFTREMLAACCHKDFISQIHKHSSIQWLYSRQVEYSEDNMEQMEDDFLFNNTYNIENLWKLLCI